MPFFAGAAVVEEEASFSDNFDKCFTPKISQPARQPNMPIDFKRRSPSILMNKREKWKDSSVSGSADSG